jgi:hypothetical protein
MSRARIFAPSFVAAITLRVDAGGGGGGRGGGVEQMALAGGASGASERPLLHRAHDNRNRRAVR